METFHCKKKCCKLHVMPYFHKKDPFEKVRRKRRKAGVVIYDPKEDRVLLVQSRGHLWGPPKGTLNYRETERECAVREVKEEVGLEISMNDFTGATKIKNKAQYFYVEMDTGDVTVQKHILENDANGVGWIKTKCLEQCIIDGMISLNQHCRIVLKRFLDREFPHSSFITVLPKRQRRLCSPSSNQKQNYN